MSQATNTKGKATRSKRSTPTPAEWRRRREAWLGRLRELLDQLATWARAEGWKVEESITTVPDREHGDFEAPHLLIERSTGELHVNPIALFPPGDYGRVDLEAIPTLSRVKLLGGSDKWTIMTDSNVPLRIRWTRKSFVQLADDLLR